MNKTTGATVFITGILIIISVYTFDYFRNEIELSKQEAIQEVRDHAEFLKQRAELSKQEAMRESWQEGYDQGYSDAYFLLTGDEPKE